VEDNACCFPANGLEIRPENLHKGIGDMRSLKFLFAAALLGSIALLGSTNAADEKKDEWTIKTIMKFAHDKENGALAKAKAGTISDEDKKKLVSAYVALPTLKPSKEGADLDAWKKATQPIADAAKAFGDGKDEKAAKLGALLKCGDCHKMFR
jgi:hypothetical protein